MRHEPNQDCPVCGAAGALREGWGTCIHPRHQKCEPRAFWGRWCASCGEGILDHENGDAYARWVRGENTSWASVWDALESGEDDDEAPIEPPRIRRT